jgi:beta-lactamase class A
MTALAGLFAPIGRAALLGLALLVAGCGEPEQPGGIDAAQVESQEAESPLAIDPQMAALEARLYEIGTAFEGEAGIAVEVIDTGRTAHFEGRRLMPQQSVSKLWVAATALELADQGALDLDDKRAIIRDDLTVFHQPVREIVLRDGVHVLTWRELLEQAITRSDNTANDILLRRVGGPEAVRAFLATHEISSVRFGPGERAMQSAIAGLDWRPSYSIGNAFFEARDQVPGARRRSAFEGYVTDPVDGASPLAVAGALAKLARGELLGQDRSAYLIAVMGNTRSGPNRLKGALPPDWQIAHKTGTGQFFDGEQSGYNDVGIITAPDGARYAIAVMIARTRLPVPERMDFMHEVVEAVIAYHDGEGALESGSEAGTISR